MKLPKDKHVYYIILSAVLGYHYISEGDSPSVGVWERILACQQQDKEVTVVTRPDYTQG